ncbi:MAG: ATP-binding protein, partial [Desulfovibrio sp.]|nr:ATP-binding protein [Desulfovibrio sp.]
RERSPAGRRHRNALLKNSETPPDHLALGMKIHHISKRTPSEWGTIFGDAAAASAALDRLIYHCTPAAIMDGSYRTRKNKLKRVMKV